MKRCIYPTSLTLSCVLLSWVCAPESRSQISPDGTLPAPTQVDTPDNLNFTINGGTQAGGNLFHSFREFSVPEMGEAFFNNAADVQNIFSRVTGGSVSDIQGVIRANGMANLFLLNPAGIVFGPNARLEIGGSFFGSTADSVVFSDNVVFSATDTNPQPLLTINVPIGLQFGLTPGDIQVQGNGIPNIDEISPLPDPDNPTAEDLSLQQRTFLSSIEGLRVAPGKTLGLVGGNLTFSGGLIQAPEGRIELGSVGANSRVNLQTVETGFALNYDDIQSFQDIQLSGKAGVFASGGRGGDIRVRGRNLTLTDSSAIRTLTLGSESGGSLVANISETISLSGVPTDTETTILGTGTFGSGRSGNVEILARQLVLSDRSEVSAFTNNSGSAGSVTVKNNESIEVNSDSFLTAATTGAGNAGNVTLETQQLLVRDGGEVSAFTTSTGNAGMVTVQAGNLVEISGIAADGESFSAVGAASTGEGILTGNAGNVTIDTGRLITSGGGNVVAFTDGTGNAGDIEINASESVELIESSPLITSGLLARTRGTGNAGNIRINTPRLSVREAASVFASTESVGQGGSITVNASELVELIDSGSGLFAGTSAQGNAGDVMIETPELQVLNGATIFVASEGQGNSELFTEIGDPGRIDINAETVRLKDEASIVALSETGKGGNINFDSTDIRIDESSVIFAYGNESQEGDIDFISDILLLDRNNSAILTLSNNRSGGSNISILPQNPEVLITALSICDTCIIGASGTIIRYFYLPELKIDFPIPIDVNSLIREDVCEVGVGSEFIIPGSGGIPPSPLEPFSGSALTELDWIEFPPENSATVPQPENAASEEEFQEPEYKPLVEAQGWIVGENGQIILVADSPTVTPAVPALNRIDCTR
ncbi:MAG: filamentous hemagglutinin N-terminal domain-containing protein [Cyanobacteria bacterium J055]|nr:MAG: filamentous hemagglutinin N-terminal domain-containing protein [Cyanobacteria bacterium J055]